VTRLIDDQERSQPVLGAQARDLGADLFDERRAVALDLEGAPSSVMVWSRATRRFWWSPAPNHW
jgi:hypothetical protein